MPIENRIPYHTVYGAASLPTLGYTGLRHAEALQTGAPASAAKTGPVQTLVSRYERGKLRRNAGRILRFATALGVSTDDLLRPATGPKPARKPSRRVLQRLERIEALPAHVQTTVLTRLDLILQSVSRKRRDTIR